MQNKAKKYANMIPMQELTDAHARLHPFEIFDRLRVETPVRYDESRSAWDVFRYDDIKRILQDQETFSSRRGVGGGEMETLLTMDPPKHTKMRNLVNKAFTPKAVHDLDPRIEEITKYLLDAAMQDGRMDFVDAVAYPLPVIVIAEMLGVPPQDRELFKRCSDVLVKGSEFNTEEAYQAVLREKQAVGAELTEYFLSIFALRREQPQDDLISALLAAEIDGEKLTDQELVSFCILLLVAGNETTTNLITNAVRLFTERPELQEQCRGNDKLIKTMIEETLRFYPPIIAIGRVATRDVELRGQQIKAGDQVISWVASANRDPEVFADPREFLVDRSPNPHLGFGFSIHFCLGAPLARLEAQIALRVILDRLRDIRLAEGAQLQTIPSPFVYGVKQYPITCNA